MMNQVILVGRLANDFEVKEAENGRNKTIITLAVPRSFKNADGIYDTDFVDCVLWDSIAITTMEYCNKGDVIGIRGRLQCRNIEKEDGSKIKIMEVVAEKVTFLSSKKNNE